MKLISKTSNPLGQETVEKIEVPAVVTPFVTKTVNERNGKTYIKISDKKYAEAVGRKVMPGNYGNEHNPLKWWWQVEED